MLLRCQPLSGNNVMRLLWNMDATTDPKPIEGDQPSPEQRQVDAANDFLEFCDRLSTGYESGFYWEDVQRALRIAAGLEKWPG